MIKDEIVKHISQRTGVDKTAVKVIVEEMMSQVIGSLTNNNPVYLRGFGSFVIKHKAKKNFHAAPGKWIEIPAHTEPSFKPCKEFKEQVKNGKMG